MLFPGYRPADMHAYVYKSQLKPDTYVYLARRDDFSALPAPLVTSLGALSFVLEVTLDAQRRLAQADPDKVRSELTERGFYLQVPPSVTSMMRRHYD